MMHSRVFRALQVAGCWLTCTLALHAQTPAAQQATPPGYTLHVGTRLVLTDVTVTDKQGNPVQGLDRSAFQILDNGKPQQIASFAEHTAAEIPHSLPPSAPGEFSNSFLQHPPAAFTVLLLDITTIRITDQMYLADQLQKFVGAMPSNGLLAVFTRAGDSVVLLQDFTSNPSLLRAAIARAVPHLQQPGSWAASDLGTLQQMVTLLRPYPGRKNLIWFSGGSNLALLADAGQLPAFVNMQPIYDELESGRIAVFPVDARGLTVDGGNGMAWQQMMMEQTAQATGGHAFYNSNGLKQIAARIVNDGADFYTLTYSPKQQGFDNKWHKVKVLVQAEGKSYQLSYRRGYYDDGSNVVAPSGTRTALRADGSTPSVSLDEVKTPILFSATVLPAAPAPAGSQTSSSLAKSAPPPRKNQTTYNIHYTFPAAGLVQSGNRQSQVTMGTGILAVNRLGAQVARQVEKVQLGIDPDKFRANPNGQVAFDEQINLPKGEDFLYIVVWDSNTGRSGMIQAPLNVARRVE